MGRRRSKPNGFYNITSFPFGGKVTQEALVVFWVCTDDYQKGYLGTKKTRSIPSLSSSVGKRLDAYHAARVWYSSPNLAIQRTSANHPLGQQLVGFRDMDAVSVFLFLSSPNRVTELRQLTKSLSQKMLIYPSRGKCSKRKMVRPLAVV